MKLTTEGISLIKSYEGCRLTAYMCPAGKLTIGYGHTGPDVRAGMKITREEADRLFEGDVLRFSVGVRGFVKVKLNDNQFSALVSFAYNCGLGAFAFSTLLKYVNTMNFREASLEFARWTRAGGKILPGLVLRRRAEAKLFMKGVIK